MIERVEEVPGLSGAAIKSVGRFYETMATLRERADEAGPVATLLEAVLHESGYLEALAAERTIEAEGRAENLETLVAGAAEFDIEREREGESEVTPLEEYLQQISLYTEQDALSSEQELVTLMTLHNAKGLEYDTVFIVGCEEGAFPHMRALEEGGEEEERRLCYVGITRARKRLYMTWARERRLFGRAEHNLPSRFVDELPSELTESHSTAARSLGTSWSTSVASEVTPAAVGRSRAGAGTADRRRRRPRQLRRRGRHRGRAGRGGGRPLLRRRLGAQADGRLRADPEAVGMAARVIDGKAVAAAVRERVKVDVAAYREETGRAPGWRRCWSATTRPRRSTWG